MYHGTTNVIIQILRRSGILLPLGIKGGIACCVDTSATRKLCTFQYDDASALLTLTGSGSQTGGAGADDKYVAGCALNFGAAPGLRRLHIIGRENCFSGTFLGTGAAAGAYVRIDTEFVTVKSRRTNGTNLHASTTCDTGIC